MFHTKIAMNNPPFCSYCYTPVEKLLRCGKCKKRVYCSTDCQRLDWKKGSHKHFCGNVGEIGFDFEVREAAEERGLGVYALRHFERDEKVMAERPVLLFRDHDVAAVTKDSVDPSLAFAAVDKLLPQGGTLADKIKTNAFSCTADDDINQLTGLFVTMSRVNHSCLGNSEHLYLENRCARILVATRVIEKDEEISFSYNSSLNLPMRKAFLKARYGFDCNCAVCTNPSIEDDFRHMKELDEAIFQRGSLGDSAGAIRAGKRLLELYEKYHVSSWKYQRTYYDLYQMAITKERTIADGIRYTRKAYEAVLAFTSDPENVDVVRLKGFVDDPSSHRSYLVLDGGTSSPW